MMKLISALLAALIGSMSFGGLPPMTEHWPATEAASEDEIFVETVDAFLAALDRHDGDAVLALFSETAREQDAEIAEDVKKLLSVCPGPTDSWYFDGALSGSYSSDYGSKTASVGKSFPVFSDGEVWWCYVDLIYRDDAHGENVGIDRLYVYMAADYCVSQQDWNTPFPTEQGLMVFAEEAVDGEVCCVEADPYCFTSENQVDEVEAAAFLAEDHSFSGFVERFGEPVAEMKEWYYLYELPDEDGERRYLRLGVSSSEDEIWGAAVVGEVDWLRTVWEE